MKYCCSILIIILFLVPKSNVLSQVVDERNSLVEMLHLVDALVYEYENYCSLSSAYNLSEDEIVQFKALFANKAILFDDISTNRTDDPFEVNEMEKTLLQYTEDIKEQYEDVKVKILRSSLGSISDKSYKKDGIIFFPVDISKVTTSYAKDKQDFEIISDLVLLIGLREEPDGSYEAKIYDIRKKEFESVRWEMLTGSQFKKRKWLMSYNLAYFSQKLEFSSALETGAIIGDVSNSTGTGFYGGMELKNYLTGSAPHGLNLSLGINFSQLTSEINTSTYSNVIAAKDTDNDSYYHIIDGNNISSSWNMQTLDFPIKLNLDYSLSPHFTFFLSGGVNLSYVLNASYVQEGIYSYRGYYPQYNITLNNQPSLGFFDDKKETIEGDINVKSTYLSWIAGSGFGVNYKKTSIVLGLYLRQSLGTINEEASYGEDTKIASPEVSFQMKEIKSKDMIFQITLRRYFGNPKWFRVNRIKSTEFQY